MWVSITQTSTTMTNVLVERGEFNRVPKDFLIAFWGSTDCAITHGYPSSVIDNHYGSYHAYRAILEKKKWYNSTKGVGKVIPYVYNREGKEGFGRKMVGLFNRVSTHDPNVDPKVTKECLEGLRRIALAGKINRISIHPGPHGVDREAAMFEHVFKDTDIKILLRHH